MRFYLDPRRWRYLFKLKYMPGYVIRQLQIVALVSRLVALRQIRKQRPSFSLARYPDVRNGGPGAVK